MRASDLKERINSLCTEILFTYNGKDCGVDPFNEKHFDMWYGEDYIEADSIYEVMEYPFFDGKALKDIVNQIEDVEGI
mgnify:FL=1